MATDEPTDPRRLAWEVLVAVEGGAFADAALGRRLERSALARRDQSLATLLVYGTLAWQGFLDRGIDSCLSTSRRTVVDLPLRILLRLGFFQLLKLSRVPDFAVVDTTVELSKTYRNGAATGFVNAVLRRCLRDGKIVDLPPPSEDPGGHLAARLSHPQWLVERWMQELGRDETEALMEANNGAARTVLRANRTRTGRDALIERLAAEGVATRPGAYSPDAIVLDEGADPASLAGFAAGLFTAQGEASQLVTSLLGVVPGAHVLDACAAPGGKTGHLAERMTDRGTVVAVDRHGYGLSHVHRTARRLGLHSVVVLAADACELPFLSGISFDAVLLDAPCSGLGTLRQHPEIRWRRSPAGITEMATLQKRLLASLAAAVRPGCPLVYATCTIGRTENEDVVKAFLDDRSDFTLEDAARWLPESARQLVGEDGFFRSLPHRHGMDGFFAARLKRCAR